MGGIANDGAQYPVGLQDPDAMGGEDQTVEPVEGGGLATSNNLDSWETLDPANQPEAEVGDVWASWEEWGQERADFFGGLFDDLTGGLRNIGPDWLDEATILLIALLVLIALRPYASLGASATS